MEKEEVGPGTPLTVSGITLIPVVKTSINRGEYKGRLLFLGTRQPVNIIVVSPQMKKAFRMNGEEIPLDKLCEEVPGLKDKLGII